MGVTVRHTKSSVWRVVPALRILQSSSKGDMADQMTLGRARQENKEGGAQSRKHGVAVAAKTYSPEIRLDIFLSWYSACRMKVLTPNPCSGEVEEGVSQVQGHPSLHSKSRLLEVSSQRLQEGRGGGAAREEEE